MTKPLRIRKTSAVQQAIEGLKAYVSERSLGGDSRLPSEAELSELLGISRLTIREAMLVLERDGLITRSHGKSTVINGFLRRLTCRIDTERDIDSFLESQGYRTHAKVLSHCWRASTAPEAEKLGIAEGDELLVVEKVFMADSMPVALYVDRVPRGLFRHEGFSPEDFPKSMFPLVEEACRCHITHDVLELAPITADARLAELFGLPRRAPILRADVLEYDDDGRAVMFNTEYYHDKFIRFTLCRTIHFSS
jgi:GntR family transcriptional regulator